MKRLLSALLCLVLVLGYATIAFAATPNAETIANAPPQLRMAYTNSTKTLVSISSGQVTGTGSLTGYQGTTTKVVITVTIERKPTSSGSWDTYASAIQTFNNYKGTLQVSKAAVAGYQYRTKAVYKAYAGSAYETFTEYSGVVSY